MISLILFLGLLEDWWSRACRRLAAPVLATDPRHSARARRRPTLEGLEGRAVPAVTSAVVGGVLSVTSDFADPIVISSAGGQVLVDGVAPQTGAAPAASIAAIRIQGGPGANLIDDTGVLPVDFPALGVVDINTGGGTGDQVQLSAAFPSMVVGGAGTADVYLRGTATNAGFDYSGAVPTAFVDGKGIGFSNVTMHDELVTSNLGFKLAPGDNETLTDDTVANDGRSRLINPGGVGSITFRNPTQSLTVTAGSGASRITYNGLDAVGRPANLGFYGVSSTSSLVFAGMNTDASFDLAKTAANLDGTLVAFPGFGTVVDGIVAQNLAFVGAPGINQVISDNAGANDGFSRISVPSTGQGMDFSNPVNSLAVTATGAGSILTFDGLDAVARPKGVTLDSGTGPTGIDLGGAAVDAVFDDAASEFVLDGLPIALPNFRGAINDSMQLRTLAINLAPNAQATVADGPTAGAGVSREINQATGRGINFLNPTAAFSARASGGTTILNYTGLDAQGRPASVSLDGGGTNSQAVFSGTATNVSFNLGAQEAWFDGKAVNYANFGSVSDNVTATNLLFLTAPGVGQIVSDGVTPGQGISRLTDPTTSQSLDFRNPSTALTFQALGDAPLTYAGLDPVNRPTDVTFAGSGTSTFGADLPGVVNTVTYDETNGNSIGFDGDVVNYVNYPGVLDSTVATNRVFLLPDGGGKYNVADNPIGDDGISRLTTLPTGHYIDFRNPIAQANIVGGSGNDTLTFVGLDNVQRPQKLTFDGGSGGNVFVHIGVAYPTRLSAIRASVIHATTPKTKVSLF